MDLGRVAKVFETFDVLRKVLDERALCEDDVITIFDPPYEIRIMRKEEVIVFSYFGEDVAVLSKKGCRITEGFEGIVEEWITALTSLGFKRFIPKSKVS